MKIIPLYLLALYLVYFIMVVEVFVEMLFFMLNTVNNAQNSTI